MAAKKVVFRVNIETEGGTPELKELLLKMYGLMKDKMAELSKTGETVIPVMLKQKTLGQAMTKSLKKAKKARRK